LPLSLRAGGDVCAADGMWMTWLWMTCWRTA
jgi:hypothetical protein